MTLKKCVACAEEIQTEAQLCKHCGVLQNDARFLLEHVERTPHSDLLREIPEHICPKCKLGDCVASVASVADGGNSVSASVGLASQFGNPINSFGGFSVGASSTALARRFQIAVPVAEFRFLTSILLGMALVAMLLNSTLLSRTGAWHMDDSIANSIVLAVVSFFVGIPAGLVMGAIIKGVEKRRLVPLQEARYRAIHDLRSAYYCSRDDIVFSSEYKGTPEQYITWLIQRYEN